jgi:hypothetical protein
LCFSESMVGMLIWWGFLLRRCLELGLFQSEDVKHVQECVLEVNQSGNLLQLKGISNKVF